MPDSIPDDIEITIDELDKIVARSETDFLHLGRRLQSIYETASDLTDQAAASTKLMQDNDGNLFTHIKQLTGAAIDNLEDVQVSVRKNMAAFPSALTRMEELAPVQQGIDKIAKYIKAIALNFVVETSRSRHQDENFTILAKEIKIISERIFEISDRIKTDADRFRTVLADAQKMVNTKSDALATLTGQAKGTVNLAIQRIQELTGLSLSTLETVESVSLAINGQVTQIIVSLQMQDNISQRISHIIQGLGDIQTLIFSDRPMGTRNYSPEQRKSLAHSILQLQRAQLEQIIEDLGTTFQDNLSAFARIDSEIRELSQTTRETRMTGDHTRLISGLSDTLSQLDLLGEEGMSILDQFRDVSASASKVSERFSGHIGLVRAMGEDSHIKALNAIIAAHKLHKDGATFKVLARELRDMTDQILPFCTRIEDILTKITATATGLKEGSDTRISGDTDAGTLGKAVSDIQEGYQTMQGQLTAAMAQGEGLTTAIEQVLGELDFLKEMPRALDINLSRLKTFETYFSDVPADARLFDDPYFLERYTMEMERSIHRQKLSPVQTVQEACTDEEFEDNVELF